MVLSVWSRVLCAASGLKPSLFVSVSGNVFYFQLNSFYTELFGLCLLGTMRFFGLVDRRFSTLKESFQLCSAFPSGRNWMIFKVPSTPSHFYESILLFFHPGDAVGLCVVQDSPSSALSAAGCTKLRINELQPSWADYPAPTFISIAHGNLGEGVGKTSAGTSMGALKGMGMPGVPSSTAGCLGDSVPWVGAKLAVMGSVHGEPGLANASHVWFH